MEKLCVAVSLCGCLSGGDVFCDYPGCIGDGDVLESGDLEMCVMAHRKARPANNENHAQCPSPECTSGLVHCELISCFSPSFLHTFP